MVEVVKKWGVPLILMAVAMSLWLQIAFYGHFLDEQENWVGSQLIHNGWRIYQDFFTHHAPLPYFIGALLNGLAEKNWLSFRWFVFVAFNGVSIFGAMILRGKLRIIPGLTLILLALTAPMLNLHQYLASTFAALGLFSAFLGLIMMENDQKTGIGAEVLMLVGIFLSLWASPSSALALLVMVSWYWSIKRLYQKQFVVWLMATNLFFPLLFLINKSWPHFWWSVVIYNRSFYLPYKLKLAESGLVALLHQINNYLMENFQNLFSVFKTLIQTVLNILFKDDFYSLFEVAINSFIEAIFEFKTLVFFLFAITAILTGKVMGIRKAIGFIVICLLLQWQSNELFHMAGYVVIVLLQSVWLLVVLWEKRLFGWVATIGLSLFMMTGTVTGTFLETRKNHEPMIDCTEYDRAELVAQHKGETMVVINGSPIIYALANKSPRLKTYYLFRWIDMVPSYHQDLEQVLINRDADYLVINESTDNDREWINKLMPIVEHGWTKISLGIYVPNQDLD